MSGTLMMSVINAVRPFLKEKIGRIGIKVVMVGRADENGRGAAAQRRS